ncbi:low temperature requirement protein A [Acidothermaceae bacterium B102]|nr:low temperature requirement protein A [Acidothermaceae bacterium B102]
MTTSSWARADDSPARVTNVELFFDLVYVFAVTQLSHHLLAHLTWGGALQTVLLLAMVWLAWVYTMWVTNWLDPERLPVRVMLLGLTLVSLVLAFALPEAFGSRGLTLGIAYAVAQIGRSVVAVLGLRGHRLQRNFERILAWCVVSGTLAIAGGVVHGHAREALWFLAVAVDLLGGWVGFATPGLGRSTTQDWTIDVDHFAERCSAFVLIALGESVVLIGSTLSELDHVSLAEAVTFGLAFLGAVQFWWLYFDRSADAGREEVSRSDDPGALGRSAYHLIHPVIVSGIITTAAADERVLSHPGATAHGTTTALVLGGTALYLLGHAAFKAVVFHVLPWSRLTAVGVLALLAPLAVHLTSLTVAALTAVVLLAVIVVDARGVR